MNNQKDFTMNKIFYGGYLKGYRTYLISGIGILSAAGGYLTGDIDIFGMLQTIFPLACVCFLRKGIQTEKDTNKKDAGHGKHANAKGHKTQKDS
jgi:hypothetical protein